MKTSIRTLAVALGLALALGAPLSVQAAESGGMKADMLMTGQSKGVVKSLDPAKGTVTLAHEAVPAVDWPAMTMAFKISPELAKGIEVGQRVNFEFEAKGMAGTITKITPIH